mmetsp:Transcript_27178/g.61370  ORF Transcript_27178/g.61370 Transcript_27178/m.61370 type:complete len:119 (+) Transcript_27178:523-879(+)
MDSICYHMGGPLTVGDIEDIGVGETVVSCPWHHHKIGVVSGKKYSQPVVFENGKPVVGPWSCGDKIFQQVHKCRIEKGRVMVCIVFGGASESYAYDAQCGANLTSGGVRLGGDGKRSH